MTGATERDPLLQSTSPQNGRGSVDEQEKRGLGPREIPRSTRYGILAGIWAATFLSVCSIWQRIVLLSILTIHLYYVEVLEQYV